MRKPYSTALGIMRHYRHGYCLQCRHMLSYGDQRIARCRAFPNGIPLPVLRGEAEHLRPLPGDQGVRFDAVDPDMPERWHARLLPGESWLSPVDLSQVQQLVIEEAVDERPKCYPHRILYVGFADENRLHPNRWVFMRGLPQRRRTEYRPLAEVSYDAYGNLLPDERGVVDSASLAVRPIICHSPDAVVVHTSFSAGPLAGRGDAYALLRQAGRWRVVRQWRIWIS